MQAGEHATGQSRETRSFQTEVKQLLQLMIHSLYSQKEIFLRELISNASDALDKRRLLALQNPALQPEQDFSIALKVDGEHNLLTIEDNGIGMSFDEVNTNIGTIAHSGTKEFIQKLKAAQENPQLIGQFGVGFYSSFMVADHVTLLTRKAGTEDATLWSSTGDGTYVIEKTKKDQPGTQITLKLKKPEAKEASEDEHEHAVDNFSDEHTLRSLVKKYSDFIPYPIQMNVWREEGEKKEKILKTETLNAMKALWTRPSSEIKQEEYNEFYKHLARAWDEPAHTIHYKVEGMMEFTALLFIPSRAPFNFNDRDSKRGLSLYVNRVFIMDHCEEVLPDYLRFVRGLVDSSDLSLNVSREILQQDRQALQIKKSITGKILNSLSDLKKNDRKKYEQIWTAFARILKEGISTDYENREKLKELLLFRTTQHDGWTSLAEYSERMKSNQKALYFISGEDLSQMKLSPHLEAVTAAGFECLLLDDAIDEWVTGSHGITTYNDKPLKSVAKGNLDLPVSEEEKTKTEADLKAATGRLGALTSAMQKVLADRVSEVKISSRLKNSPACLVSGEHDFSPHVEKLIKAMSASGAGGSDLPSSKRILEINPTHPLFETMLKAAKDEQTEWTELLYGQALLSEGSQLPDPVAFAQRVTKLMLTHKT